MPDNNEGIQQEHTPDVQWQDAEYRFNGAWMPDVDSNLIGPENYQTLENLRYTDEGLESVNGYTRVNPTTIGSTEEILNGHQLRTNKTQTSYVLVQAMATGDNQGTVFSNRVSPGTTGTTNFDHQTGGTTRRLDLSGNEYRDDYTTSLQGRFSDAPQGNIAYCNSEESTIFGGDEQPVAAAFSLIIDDSELMPNQVDRDFSGASAWAQATMNTYDETDDLSIASTVLNQYCTCAQASVPTTIGNKYRLSFDYSNGANGGWYLEDFSGTQLLGFVDLNQSGSRIFLDFTAQTTGGIRLVSRSATSSGDFDNFSLISIDITTQIDVTERVQNVQHVSSPGDMFTINATGKQNIYIFTTRPVQAIKFYVDSGNVNGTASTLALKTWTGKSWQSTTITTDGTSSGGASLAQTGTIYFAHTASYANPMHFEELFLYAYCVTLSAGDADIYHITVDPGMQKIKDVWDGVYRQPIQFQVLDGTAYFDYTLQVQESSDLNSPVGGILDGLTSSDKLYIMFEERMSAIKLTMLGDLVNAATETISLKFWNGTAWNAIYIDDGTLTSGTTSLSQTGLISWMPNPVEQPITLFGSYGYAYEISFSGTLTGTKGTAAIELVVDICTGVPATLTVPPFDWCVSYNSRLMLGSYSKGDEGNRMDYSVTNAPDVWNGFDSSQNGTQSLYFGGIEPIVAGTQIYNRFGANVYSMLLVLKQNELYILVGDTPEEFTIYPVAKTIGCVSPLSLATAEIGMDLGGGLTRNVAMWISHSGPVMFDGALLTPIPGIDSYFDPTDSNYVKFSLMTKAVGWVDYNYKEYNIIIPSGSAATENNTWLVYDLARRKWFKKVPATGHYPQCAFSVIHPTTGRRYTYGGKDDGFVVQLETGNVWQDGSNTSIAQSVTTGDFSPTNNMWDEIVIRKHKLLLKKVSEVSSVTNTATIKYYKNTDTTARTVGTIDLDEDQINNQKLVKSIRDMNEQGVYHAFNYSATTSNVDKGLQPVKWGIQYRTLRKENTAT
jgi:hypothetical protein